MTISTKTGDKGKTTLCNGEVVYKDDIRIEACGVVDELNSSLGVCTAMTKNKENKKIISDIQNKLFIVGANLSMPLDKDSEKLPTLTQKDLDKVESQIEKIEKSIPQLKNFILPQGNKLAAMFFMTRSICRRAERIIVSYIRNAKTKNQTRKEIVLLIIKYINRLSDLLFLLARKENIDNGIEEIDVRSKKTS